MYIKLDSETYFNKINKLQVFEGFSHKAKNIIFEWLETCYDEKNVIVDLVSLACSITEYTQETAKNELINDNVIINDYDALIEEISKNYFVIYCDKETILIIDKHYYKNKKFEFIENIK